MIDNLCPRCDSKFFAAYPETGVSCPFCGYVLARREGERRSIERALITRDCLLSKGVVGRTVDLSVGGVCVNIQGSKALEKKDRLRVVIKDFEVDKSAEVVWVKDSGEGTTRAGLRFVEPAI